MAGYIFGGNTGETAESLARKRAIAEAMQARAIGQTPRNVGEGLAAIGNALAARGMTKRLDRTEREGRDKAAEVFAALMGRGEASPAAGAMPAGAGTPFNPQGGSRAAPAPQGGGQDRRAAFVEQMTPLAMAAAEKTGLDPRLIMAQAALETGWGESAPGNNYFGIKSHGRPGGQNLATMEAGAGGMAPTTANFRAYGSPAESAQDYAQFVTENPRYQPMLQAEGLDAQVEALGRSGYATDPNYASKVAQIARDLNIPGQAPAQPAGGQPSGMPGQPPIQTLVAALDNPYMSQGQRAVISAMLEKRMAGNDPMAALNLRKAELEVRNLENPPPKERKMYKAADGYHYWTDAPTERVNPDAVLKAEAPLVSIGAGEREYDKAVGKSNAETRKNIMDAGMAASTRIAEMDALEQALDGVYTGAGGDTALQLRRIGRAFGIEDDSIGDAEFAQSIARKMALELRNPAGGAGMPGALSDKDREFLESMTPGLSKTPDGNRKIITAAKAVALRNQQIAEMAAQHEAAGGMVGDVEFMRKVREFADANPLFPDNLVGPDSVDALLEKYR